MKIMNYSYSVGRGYGCIKSHKGAYIDGDVITPHGIVRIYAQGSEKYVNASSLSFVWKGRVYCRRFEKRYSPRGIVTKAKQFAKEIADD